MSPESWSLVILCLTAFAAGALNAIAGGGTLLTFPALTGVIPAAYANATSTLALLPGSIAGAVGYRSELASVRPTLQQMAIPSLAGGFLGAWLVALDEKRFATLVPWLILTATALFVLQQPVLAWLKRRQPADAPTRKPGLGTQLAVLLFQFVVGVYGGYFGAGIGILMLTALGFLGVGTIHQMNAVKTVLAALINAASIVIFLYQGLIVWNYALIMAVAASAGGYLGARVARRLHTGIVRAAVVVIGLALSVYYFVWG